MSAASSISSVLSVDSSVLSVVSVVSVSFSVVLFSTVSVDSTFSVLSFSVASTVSVGSACVDSTIAVTDSVVAVVSCLPQATIDNPIIKLKIVTSIFLFIIFIPRFVK